VAVSLRTKQPWKVYCKYLNVKAIPKYPPPQGGFLAKFIFRREDGPEKLWPSRSVEYTENSVTLSSPGPFPSKQANSP